MSVRRAFLDIAPGETRGVITLDGLPERLWIERTGEAPWARLGARYHGRVAEVLKDAALAYVDIGIDPPGLLKLSGAAAGLTKGAGVRVEVAAEARAGKGPVLHLLGPASGSPEPVEPPPTLWVRLAAAAPGAEIIQGPAAREAADDAQEAALAVSHRLAGGVMLSIEATRALAAVDVDLGGEGAGPRKAMEANLRAVRHAARLLRLKRIGGAAVIDLVGFPRQGAVILEAAKTAFAPDQPGVTVLPVSRLGLLQVGLPHRERPIIEQLTDARGSLSPRTLAQGLVRDLQRQGAASPMARPVAVCAPAVAALLRPLVAELGPRFGVIEELGWEPSRTDIRLS